MKLLRDVARLTLLRDDDTAGECDECGWRYSRRSERLGLIRHHEGCDLHNTEGIWE